VLVHFALVVDVMPLSLCCGCAACLLQSFVCLVAVMPLDCEQKGDAENQHSTATAEQEEEQC
jgi:hypothetical protein